jgi:hypothetical protein
MCTVILILVNSIKADFASILFILHDAGESYMVQPVIDRLLNNPKYSSTIAILTIGEPSTDIFANYTQQILLSDYNIDIDIIDGYSRTQMLNMKDLLNLVKGIQPKLIVTGTMSHKMMYCIVM